MHPTSMVIGIASRRKIPEPRSISTAAPARVAAPTAGPAIGDSPAGTSSNLATAMGMAETAITMKATPDTTGVIIRRSWASQNARANWTREAAIIKLDITGSPPSSTASTQTAMKGAAGPIRSMCPDPSRPSLVACKTVTAPPTTREANTTHAR